MRTTRIYIANPEINQPLTLGKEAAHHVMNVLRIKVGDELVVFDGEGHEFKAAVVGYIKKTVTIQLTPIDTISSESNLSIHLIQGLAKGDKMDLIIQKAVELGVQEITPLITTYTDVKLDNERQGKKHQHWQRIVIHACEQSGRSTLPIIHPIINYSTFIQQLKENPRQTLLLHPLTANALTKSVLEQESVNILIGPEGGFSDREIDQGQQAGMSIVNLGTRILRTETAGLATIATLQALWGDFR